MMAAPAVAGVMIVRATGPSAHSFAPGRVLPDDAHITLRQNDELVVLDPHGTRTLRGPGSFIAGQDTGKAMSTLAALSDQRTARRARIGAVRAVRPQTGPSLQPNIWFVDAGRAGTVCVADPQAATLWRDDATGVGSTTITASTGKSAKVDWIKGEASQPWPATLPIADNAGYRITGAGAAPGGTAVNIRVVKDKPADLQQLAGALIADDCQGQLNVLIETASNDKTGPE